MDHVTLIAQLINGIKLWQFTASDLPNPNPDLPSSDHCNLAMVEKIENLAQFNEIVRRVETSGLKLTCLID